MATFYRGNSDVVIGAPARIMIAPHDAPVPLRLSEIVNLTTYEANATYQFADIGLTSAPFTLGRQAETNNWDNQQFGRFRSVPTNYFSTAGTTAIEVTQENKVRLMGAVAGDDPEANEHITYFPAKVAFDRHRLVALFLDENGLVHAIVLPSVQWDGSAIQQSLARGEMFNIPLNFQAWVSDDVIDPDTGLGCDRFDLDQFSE